VRAGCVYYTDNLLRPEIAGLCQRQLQAAAGEREIVTVGLNQRAGFGVQYTIFGDRGVIQMHRQILLGLEQSKADYVFMTEHDVMYHSSHFEFVPPRGDTFYYNVNVFKVRYPDGHAVWTDDCQQVSGLCAARPLLISFYQQRLAQLAVEGFNRHYEPGLKQTVGGQRVENWTALTPNLDIRHDANLTLSKWAPSEFRNRKYARGWKEADSVDGWGCIADLFKVTV
jgi:hypothetical protein